MDFAKHNKRLNYLEQDEEGWRKAGWKDFFSMSLMIFSFAKPKVKIRDSEVKW